MDNVRLKATEMAVELLREPMSNLNLMGLVTIEDDKVFDEQATEVAQRLGGVIKKVSLEIEKYIR